MGSCPVRGSCACSICDFLMAVFSGRDKSFPESLIQVSSKIVGRGNRTVSPASWTVFGHLLAPGPFQRACLFFLLVRDSFILSAVAFFSKVGPLPPVRVC